MRLKLTFLSLVILIILASCADTRLKEAAKQQTIEFFSALKNGDERHMKDLYEGFKNFDSYYKSDSAKINYIAVDKNKIEVSVHNRFTNGFGKLSERDIFLFFNKDKNDKLTLKDTKGLCSFEDNDEYKFGSNTGCINTHEDTTDQQILIALKKTHFVMLDKAFLVYLELKRDVVVTSWTWETGYGSSASGRGIVMNNSDFNLPYLKYKITYKDYAGNPITTDDGYISYNEIEAGESKAFTFYSSYVGNASRATIELAFDDDEILKYLANKDWTGNECDEYFKQNPEKLKQL